ncbi:MAG: ABC transporter permease [Candidatus Hodarchaeota archaeon]
MAVMDRFPGNFVDKITDDFRRLRFELGNGPTLFLLGVFGFFALFLILPILTILFWSIFGEIFLFQPFTEIFADSSIWGGGFGNRLSAEKAPLAALWMWAIVLVFGITCLYFWKLGQFVSKRDIMLGKYLGWALIIASTVLFLGFIAVFMNELKMVFAEPIESADRPWGTKWIIQGPDMGGLFNSIIVALSTMILSTVFGLLFAYIMARFTFPGKNFFRPLILIPLIIPPFVSIIGFHSILGETGIANILLYDLLNMRIVLGGSVGIVFVQFLHFYTLVYLNVYSSLVNIDPSLEEAAENLGAGSAKLFSSVTIPLAMPGLAAGAILAFILAIEDLGTPLIFKTLQTGDEFQYMPTLIFEQIIIFTPYAEKGYLIDGKYAALAAILVIIAVIGFLLIRRFVSLKHYAMISKGRVGEPRTKPASSILIIFFYILLLLFLPIALIPHVGTMLFAFGYLGFGILLILGAIVVAIMAAYFFLYRDVEEKSKKSIGIISMIAGIGLLIVGSIVGLQFYIDSVGITEAGFRRFLTYLNIGGTPDQVALNNFQGILISVLNMFFYSVIATLIIVVIATITAYFLVRKNFPGKALLDTIVTMPLAIPGIIIGFGYFIMFYGERLPIIGLFNPALNPIPLLIISYTVRKFTFTIRAAFAGTQQVDVQLEEASFNLGANRAQTLGRITLPMIAMSVFAGGLISLVYCMSEVSTTIILLDYTPDPSTFGTATWKIWDIYSDPNPALGYPMAAVLGVLLMIIQAIAIFITNVILKSRSEALTGI